MTGFDEGRSCRGNDLSFFCLFSKGLQATTCSSEASPDCARPSLEPLGVPDSTLQQEVFVILAPGKKVIFLQMISQLNDVERRAGRAAVLWAGVDKTATHSLIERVPS